MNNIKEELQFPLDWNYRIIADESCQGALEGIKKVLAAHNAATEPKVGKLSKNGSYRSYSVKVTFEDHESLRALSSALSALPFVKFLL